MHRLCNPTYFASSSNGLRRLTGQVPSLSRLAKLRMVLLDNNRLVRLRFLRRSSLCDLFEVCADLMGPSQKIGRH
jgi:hypothetical protein